MVYSPAKIFSRWNYTTGRKICAQLVFQKFALTSLSTVKKRIGIENIYCNRLLVCLRMQLRILSEMNAITFLSRVKKCIGTENIYYTRLPMRLRMQLRVSSGMNAVTSNLIGKYTRAASRTSI